MRERSSRRLARALLAAAIATLAGRAAAGDETLPAGVAVGMRNPTFAAKVVGPAFSHRSPAATFFAHPVDLDADGRTDLLIAFGNFPPAPNRAEPVKMLRADPVSFAFSDRTASLIAGAPPSFVHPRVAGVGDFNKDGKRDLFVGGHGYDQSPFSGEKDALVLSLASGRPRATIAPPALATFTHALAVGDINGDGVDDLYVGAICCSTQGPYVLLGRKGAGPVVDSTRLGPAVAFRQAGYTAAALADVRGGKVNDLVLGTWGGADSVVYFNQAGSFNRAAPDLILPPGLFGRTNTIVVDILAADLNTDGRPDLVMSETKHSPFYVGYGLQVLMNTGGTFADQTASRMLKGSGFNAAGSWKMRIFAADFYGDGLIDLVTHRACPNGPGDHIVWLNDGSGTFTPQGRALFDATDTSNDCAMLVPVDVNKDGRSDLVQIKGMSATSDAAWTYVNQGPAASGGLSVPTIVRQPAAAVVAANKRLLLSVSARGQRPLRFQWFKDTKAIKGATKPVLDIAKASAAHSGTYKVTISNVAGTAVSKSVRVKVP